jgi:hypothetical protein
VMEEHLAANRGVLAWRDEEHEAVPEALAN